MRRCTWLSRTAVRSSDLDHPCVSVRCTRPVTQRSELAPGRRPARLTTCPERWSRCATAASSDRPARALIAAAVQQRLVRPQDLSDLGRQRAGRCPSDGSSARPSTTSPAARTRCPSSTTPAACGVPGCLNRRVNGRSAAERCLVPRQRLHDWLVTVEVNGMQHHEPAGQRGGRCPSGGLQTAGRLVVDVSSYAVRHQRGRRVAHGRGADVTRLGAEPRPVQTRLPALRPGRRTGRSRPPARLA